MEYTGALESEDYPGFFYVPSLSATLINTEGRVIDTSRGWCPLSSISPQGYPCLNSENDRRLIHRLLALTFLPHPELPLEDLEVNHIDGVKTNNALSNLEWVTYSGNILHAYQTGLRTDNTPILVKDLRDGVIVRHYSLQDCARAFGVDGAHIHHYLKSHNYGKVCWNYYVIIREGDSWPPLTADDIGKYRNGTAKQTYVTNENGSDQFIFDSFAEAAAHFGFSKGAVRQALRRRGDKPYRGWVFKFIDDINLTQGKTYTGTASPIH